MKQQNREDEDENPKILSLMGQYKNQHFVQAAHLESWTDQDDKVYVCDLLKGEIHKGPPSSQAFKKYYYCFTDEKTGEKIYEIESSLLPDIEKALPMIKKLDLSQKLTQQEWNDVATYVAFQKTRTPFFEAMCNTGREKMDREMIMKTLNDETKFNKFIADYKLKNKDSKPLPEREDLAKSFSEGAFLFSYPREVSLQLMLQISEPLANLYARSKWTILSAPKKRAFIISDNPATTISFERRDGTRELTETIFPLSPHACLLIEQEGRRSLHETEENIEGVREINRRLILHSKRYIYSHSKELLEWAYREYVKYKHFHEAINTNSPSVRTTGAKLFMKRINY